MVPPRTMGMLVLLGLSGLTFVLGVSEQRPSGPVPQLELDGTGGVSPEDFGSLVNGLSEPEGYFDTDNFISNETSYLHVVGRLAGEVAPGNVYFGVGPDQNFSYIVHVQPSLAIISDVRRQNMLQHLLFKVLIEDSADRYAFLCRLFARRCGESDPDAPLEAILTRVGSRPADTASLENALIRVPRVLTEDYGIDLDSTDRQRLEYVHRSFVDSGLDLRFSSYGRRSSVRYPTFTELMLERNLEGEYASYLSSEVLFGRLRAFQRENRLVPIVGDFAGDLAMPAVAAFLSSHGLEISVFYASNVEFYLFGSRDWDRYVENVQSLPFSDDAVFIRSYFPTYGFLHPQNVRPHRATTLIQSVAGFLGDAASGGLRTYWDVVSRHTD